MFQPFWSFLQACQNLQLDQRPFTDPPTNLNSNILVLIWSRLMVFTVWASGPLFYYQLAQKVHTFSQRLLSSLVAVLVAYCRVVGGCWRILFSSEFQGVGLTPSQAYAASAVVAPGSCKHDGGGAGGADVHWLGRAGKQPGIKSWVVHCCRGLSNELQI